MLSHGRTCPNARWLEAEAIDHQAERLTISGDLEGCEAPGGGSPNNDTLYSRAWVYLKDEPIILTVPAISDRYYSMEIIDFMGDNFAYVGTRATGTKAGNFAIVGPGWTGALPVGVTALPPSSDALGDPRSHRRQGRGRSGRGARNPGQV